MEHAVASAAALHRVTRRGERDSCGRAIREYDQSRTSMQTVLATGDSESRLDRSDGPERP